MTALSISHPPQWVRFFIFLLSVSSLPAQAPEIASQDAPVIFRSTSNLIPVPVVVRDSKGQAVGNLSVDDFQLLDNGKPQAISKFTLEKFGEEQLAPAAPKPTPALPGEMTPPAPVANDAPDRFVAYIFDDLHIDPADLQRTRAAAQRQIDASRNRKERVAIYTVTGLQDLEFTADREKIHATLAAINANAAAASKAQTENSCPPVTFYMGDQIHNKHDQRALDIAVQDAMVCLHRPSPDIAVAVAKREARVAVALGDRELVSAFSKIRAIIGRMTAMPGKRNIVLISQGFFVPDNRRAEQMAMIEDAIKAGVVIGGLDTRGLYTMIPGGAAGERTLSIDAMRAKIPYQKAEALTSADVVAEIAHGTGGLFFENSNDYDGGIARVAATPQYMYVLGFSPQDLKLDGKFHSLKVTLKNKPGLELQVRKGYYAPNQAAGAAEQSRTEIQETFFSRDEVHNFPATLQTQYFKLETGSVTLSAVTKIDAKKLTFRRENDRNRNDVIVVLGVFDNDGNYISGVQKTLQLRLQDRTLQSPQASGIGVKHEFAVTPGRYTVRMVVRDTEGQSLSAQSTVVDIP